MNDETSIRAQVLGCLQPGYLTVIAGYGYGMLDGGVAIDIPTGKIPVPLRMPNTKFLLTR